MDPVAEIFDAFDGSPTKLAKATGLPVQTVCDWRVKGKNIPDWRRPVVLDAIRREGKTVSAATLAYLRPTEQARDAA